MKFKILSLFVFCLLFLSNVSTASTCIQPPNTTWTDETLGSCSYTDVCYVDDSNNLCQQAVCSGEAKTCCETAPNSQAIICYETIIILNPPVSMPETPVSFIDRIGQMLEDVFDSIFHKYTYFAKTSFIDSRSFPDWLGWPDLFQSSSKDVPCGGKDQPACPVPTVEPIPPYPSCPRLEKACQNNTKCCPITPDGMDTAYDSKPTDP